MPDEPEVHGLLALMLIHHARREARFSGDELVLLEDQDRSLWDAEEIAAGRATLDRAIALRGRGPYVLQAAIASLQSRRADRLDRGRRALRRARADDPLAGSRSSTARSRSPRPGAPSRRSRSSTASTSTTTSTCTRPAASCCAASAGPSKPARRMSVRSSWPARSPSVASSRAGSPNCRPLRATARPTQRGCPLGARPFVVST